MDKCRLDSDRTMGRGLWHNGQHYYIDRNLDFVHKHDLPKIATCYSPGGQVFDIYRGWSTSTLGSPAEFACAVYSHTIQ